MKITLTECQATDPRANLSGEEELFGQLRRNPRPACMFYVCDPCVVLGRSNRAAEWVNAGACAADGIPVLRRFSGGGAVYLDHNVLNYSFITPRELLDACSRDEHDGGSSRTMTQRYIDFFRGIIIRALLRGGEGVTPTGVSDISLNGRKISGNAQRIAANLVLHHGTLMLRCPLDDIKRYLPLPPNRLTVSHDSFLTGLEEEGHRTDRAELQNWLHQEYALALRHPAD